MSVILIYATASMAEVVIDATIQSANTMTQTNNIFPIPSPIQAFVDTTNSGDSEAFVATFSEDTYIRDWWHIFRGHKGAASWNQSDNIGKKAHFDIQAIRQGEQPNSYILTVKVSGGGFNGVSDILFNLEGEFISKMIIAP